MEIIVKVQRPVVHSGKHPQLLVYDEERVVLQLIEPTEEWMQFFTDEKPKVFVYADIEGGKLKPLRAAPWQDW